MAISNKEKFLQQKHEIRSIRYYLSGTNIYDTYKDVETLAEKAKISADFLYEIFAKEPVAINRGLETYIHKYERPNREEFVFIQILRYKQYWKPDVPEDEVDRRYFEYTGHELIYTNLTEEEIDARMEEYYRKQEEEHFKFIKSSVCNDYYRVNKDEPTEEDVWGCYHHMEAVREDLKAISSYLNNNFKTEFDVVDNDKYTDALKALDILRDYLSHFQE